MSMLDILYTHACDKCDGCGKVADTDNQEPWWIWEQMPDGLNLAVKLGLVKPINCPKCDGSGNLSYP